MLTMTPHPAHQEHFLGNFLIRYVSYSSGLVPTLRDGISQGGGYKAAKLGFLLLHNNTTVTRVSWTRGVGAGEVRRWADFKRMSGENLDEG